MEPILNEQGVFTTQVVDPDKNIMQYDILDEAISNKEPLESVFSKLKFNDHACFRKYHQNAFGICRSGAVFSSGWRK